MENLDFGPLSALIDLGLATGLGLLIKIIVAAVKYGLYDPETNASRLTGPKTVWVCLATGVPLGAGLSMVLAKSHSLETIISGVLSGVLAGIFAIGLDVVQNAAFSPGKV